ncbi:MAG: hypothetical protein J7623_31075 [Chitinophaga sp.]|uniref:DUF5683 domain-containing protein n=1 Tax=Chitinophaga sp. TaxID=1869181 RepID=UPI001B0CB40B|nr:DUF5683 domain-containing protein [Chitinophaga sp.]MBO9733125.1 hypothetical protein [Chitinophaga sp.]
MANKSEYILHLLQRGCLLFLLAMVIAAPLRAQQDTLRPIAKTMDTLIRPIPAPGTDTVKANKAIFTDSAYVPNSRLPHSPRKAALYSAVVPGLGQAYNREYWKMPLVYAALGTCTYFFIDNMNTYKLFRDAYRLRMDGNPDTETTDERIKRFSNEGLKVNRDQYRQYVDYSVLFFILAYGLNIVDATVFAHLRNFDMSDDLSMRVSPTLINNRTLGIGVHLSIGGKKSKGIRYVAGL